MLTTIFFAVVCVLLFSLVGWLFPSSKFWSKLDFLIYPLGIAGVILAHFTAEEDRRILALDLRAQQLEREIESHRALRPRSEPAEPVAAALSRTWVLLETELELGRVCQGSTSLAANCVVRSRAVSALQEAKRAFEIYSTSRTPNGLGMVLLCEAFSGLVDALYDDRVLSSFVAQSLQTAFDAAFYRQQGVLSLPAAISYADEFSQQQTELTEELFRSASESSALAFGMRTEEISFARTILIAFSPCFGVPASVRDGSLTNWQVAMDELAGTLREVNDSMGAPEAQSTAAQASNFVSLQLWPYLLVIVLSAQFGKAIAAKQPTL